MKKIIFTFLMLIPMYGFSVLPSYVPTPPGQPDFTPKNIYIHHPNGSVTIVR